MALSKVVLPQPLRPKTAVIVPQEQLKEMFLIISQPLYPAHKDLTSIIMPTGSSYGAKRVLDRVSHSNVSIAPKSAEKGRRTLLSLPVNLATKCGQISPTKPRRPARQTALPDSKDTPMQMINLVRPVRIPSPSAILSPRASTFIS